MLNLNYQINENDIISLLFFEETMYQRQYSITTSNATAPINILEETMYQRQYSITTSNATAPINIFWT